MKKKKLEKRSSFVPFLFLHIQKFAQGQSDSKKLESE